MPNIIHFNTQSCILEMLMSCAHSGFYLKSSKPRLHLPFTALLYPEQSHFRYLQTSYGQHGSQQSSKSTHELFLIFFQAVSQRCIRHPLPLPVATALHPQKQTPKAALLFVPKSVRRKHLSPEGRDWRKTLEWLTSWRKQREAGKPENRNPLSPLHHPHCLTC